MHNDNATEIDRLRAELAECATSLTEALTAFRAAESLREGLDEECHAAVIRAEKAEAALSACERERDEARRIANEPCGCDPAPGLRAMLESGTADLVARAVSAEGALAACETERDDLKDELRIAAFDRGATAAEAEAARERAKKAESNAYENGKALCVMRTDLTTARAEVERLRGALAAIVAPDEGDGISSAIVFQQVLSLARAALSPSSPAAPSSAAPSSEYARGYARAVELLRVADGRLSELIARPNEAHDAGVFIQRQIRAALDVLLTAPREVGEAEVERIAEAVFPLLCRLTGCNGVLWSSAEDGTKAAARDVVRAVLAAQGEGK